MAYWKGARTIAFGIWGVLFGTTVSVYRKSTDISNKPRFTSSGIPIEKVYGPSPPDPNLGEPGQFPYTRGPYSDMYRGKLWTMRQYAGFGSATETNQRFRQLLTAGQTGLSVAFDLPTQMGLDSDHPLSRGEVGKVGVAIDTVEDMAMLFDRIPLSEVSTSMTINATAPMLLILYQLVAESRGVSPEQIRGTTQNDILKEYAARGTYIFPPQPSMRLVTDLFAYAASQLPAWNTISISGYHIREAGASAAQELAFTIANGIAYTEAALAAGLSVDEFGPRLSFFWNGHNQFFEEIAKYRAGRRIWARLMTTRFGATNPRSAQMRFHTQTAGSTLTAQQPENNIVRTTTQALAAVLGGTQSLHTNAYDEALGLPTEKSAQIALRTQQILAYELGVDATADPLAGSYFVEALTDALEEKALDLIAQIEEQGGAVNAVENGWIQRQIEESAYAEAQSQETEEKVVVGVNRFTADQPSSIPVTEIDPEIEIGQCERLAQLRQSRDQSSVDAALAQVTETARGSSNLLYPIKTALAALATVGEVADALRTVFGTYHHH